MENNCITYWDKCCEILKDNLSASAYRTWFAPIVPLHYENKVLVVQVNSQYVVEYIEENFIDLLRKTLLRVFGEGIRLEYRVLIDSNSGAGSMIPSQGVSEATPAQYNGYMPVMPSERRMQMPQLESQLNPQYTFPSFVEGDCNRLARTAGVTIASNPGRNIFNPLFVYGGSGVGKTHLVNAIGNSIKHNYPDKRVLYVSANTFQVQYTDAVVSNKVNDFINFYQTIDVLIVDDIQYWADKKGTQNTFFFIFNHLHQTGKQLILTSDCAPVDLKGLEDRLITRFKWGLTAEILRPDFQLRKDILKNRIWRDGLAIPEEVVDYIAENVRNNVRDLEGVLASLLAYSTLTNTEINIELTEQVVSRLVKVSSADITIENITDAVCRHFNIPEKMLVASTRKREIAQARMVAMYLAKQMTNKSLMEIGRQLGNRNHATVLHAINTITNDMAGDAFLRRSVSQIENELHS
ncbi:MAG: chromosomal replication initiator protein DnaA [Paludibacteraceae bacterium]|nr:chromosomal replication initiator protein DnaA [Paludibacteraceae bacterium]